MAAFRALFIGHTWTGIFAGLRALFSTRLSILTAKRTNASLDFTTERDLGTVDDPAAGVLTEHALGIEVSIAFFTIDALHRTQRSTARLFGSVPGGVSCRGARVATELLIDEVENLYLAKHRVVIDVDGPTNPGQTVESR